MSAAVDRTRLSAVLTQEFMSGGFDLSGRRDAPPPGWDGMPEVAAATALRRRGVHDGEVRRFLTLVAALDRARDADALWRAAEGLHASARWAFDPNQVVRRSLDELTSVLREARVSQRHRDDVGAWARIAFSLAHPSRAPMIWSAVEHGRGDAPTLLRSLRIADPSGRPLFPYLKGPKVGPMWVRMLAVPGGATIERIDELPVAVDVQVRKVSEYLAVTATVGVDMDSARPTIQAAWAAQIARAGAAGPTPLEGTAAALDPAIWFMGKWGCTRCERAGERRPISQACALCSFSPSSATPRY